jgi:transposase InsO family protein
VAQRERVGRNRVARVIREHGISGSRPRRFKATTDSAHQLPVAENVVTRDFSPPQRNRTWAADITYVRTHNGWLYLAVVIDLYSRRVVGWAVADHMRTELVLRALNMAVIARNLPAGLVMHSDRGSQYASRKHRETLERHGMICSISRKGDCWDNAVVDSFFGTLKQELIYRHTWPTRLAVTDAVRSYIECFYNVRRRHSAIGYVSPLEFEMPPRVSMAA